MNESFIEKIRDSILNLPAELVSRISRELDKLPLPLPSDGPSSDDFSYANANQIVLSENDL